MNFLTSPPNIGHQELPQDVIDDIMTNLGADGVWIEDGYVIIYATSYLLRNPPDSVMGIPVKVRLGGQIETL